MYYDNIKEITTYLIQIKVNVNKNNDYFYTKNLVYVRLINAEDYKSINILNIFIIAVSVLTLIFLALIIYLIYVKKKNKNLEQILQTSFLEKEDNSEKEIGVDYI